MNDIELIPLGKLRLSDANVRKNDSNLFIEELAANIEAKGLLQNLIVVPAKKRGMFDVTAGGRRLRALGYLLEAGKLPKDYPVACRVLDIDAAEQSELSLIENVIRLDMTPTDEIRAYKHFVNEGSDLDAIAKRFGRTRRFIEGRLRLADLADPIFAALEEGKITLDVAKAYLIFAIADSRALYSAQALGTTLRAPSPSLYLANYPESRAHTLMADMRETLDLSWTEHRRTVDRFSAFSALNDDSKASWLAWCMAKTLEASMGIDKKTGQSGPEPIDLHDHLAALMGINVASHWRPTSANYFDRVSKQALLAHVSEVGGPTMAASFMGSKKGDLSASCEKLFAGETIVAPEVKEAALAWVPEAMRFRALAANEPDDEAPVVHEPEAEADELEPAEPQDAEAGETVNA